MTSTRAVTDERAAIIREIERMRENLANRSCSGFVMLDKLRLYLLRDIPKEKRDDDHD